MHMVSVISCRYANSKMYCAVRPLGRSIIRSVVCLQNNNGLSVSGTLLPSLMKRCKRNYCTSSSKLMAPIAESLVWVDMEMTGLDPVRDHILEISCLITNPELEIIQEGPRLIVHQSDAVLSNMNDWCVINHEKSGLTSASRNSKTSLQEAEDLLVSFLKKHVPAGKCPLAGNSVYMDRLFIRNHLPKVEAHLHYRIVDVSTVKELCRRWYPEIYKCAPKKKLAHRSLDDIKDSIEELKYYRNAIFIKPNN